MRWLLCPCERPGTHCIEGWMGLKVWSGQVWKILLQLGFIPQTFHPVASCNAEYSILAHSLPRHSVNNMRLDTGIDVFVV